jgi:Sulfatase
MKPFDVVAAGVLTAAVALGSDPVLDDNWGQVVQAIRDLGIAENTLVIWTTDNGAWIDAWPDAGYTPFRGMKGSSFEGGFRVPAKPALAPLRRNVSRPARLRSRGGAGRFPTELSRASSYAKLARKLSKTCAAWFRVAKSLQGVASVLYPGGIV